MSSLPRNMQRRAAKKRLIEDDEGNKVSAYKGRAQHVRMHADGRGYDTCRPTKGYIRVCARRLAAQFVIGQVRERVFLGQGNQLSDIRDLMRPPAGGTRPAQPAYAGAVA